MLSSRWNHVKDPEARESLRLIEQAINQGFTALGIDPFPSQLNPVAQAGNPLNIPQPPLALSVSSVSGGVLVQVTANPVNIRPVNYFVETSTTADFHTVTVYRFGLLQSDTINIGTTTLFFRCRCQYFNSGFSGYIPFGNPTAVSGGSASLGSTTGSGAVVLQTSATINSPTINTPAISSPTITSPTINSGISSGTGFQHVRVASNTTDAPANSFINTTVNWPTSFADANYTCVVTLDSANVAEAAITQTASKTTSSIIVQITNGPSGGNANGTQNCVAIHD